MLFEKRLPHLEVFVQRSRGGQVHVRLQEGTADHVPASGFHEPLNGVERIRIVPQNFLVDE